MRRPSSEGAAAAAALAVGRPASPGESRAALLSELQDRLVNLAVEKAALEKELEMGRGQLQQLQHKVRVRGCMGGSKANMHVSSCDVKWCMRWLITSMNNIQ
jgi:hypothetical protein